MTDTMTGRETQRLGRTVRWGNDVVVLVLGAAASAPVRLLWVGQRDQQLPEPLPSPAQPLVEVFAVGHGHANHNLRHTASAVGARLRYVCHAEVIDGPWSTLTIEQEDRETGLVVRSTLRAARGVAGVQSWTEVRNAGTQAVILQAVSSFTSGAFGAGVADLADVDSITGVSEWLGEGRWQRTPIRDQSGLVDLNLRIHQAQDARSRITITSQGTWSSGERMPCGVLENRADGTAWAWQVEHNGAWHTELAERVGSRVGELVLGLFGPTDTQHQWTLPLAPGESFRTVPVSLCFADEGWEQAVAHLTAHRRALRAERPTPDGLPVVFNDYMNTLMGDPTTAKLTPLIGAAAAAGAEYFCIDAGWYDDGGDWWDSVGEWEPSELRFPDGGLGAVIDRIRDAGMVPGLWLEPEVIGVCSPMVERLPAEAFLQRAGTPIVEQHRLHLDLRHPAAREHLDAVVDRLVTDYGVGYFKLDYNITPGQGTDLDAPSPGAGLLEHNRAHLTWLEGVLDRHPELVIENCASGALRADYAMLTRLHLQSTSDQQDPLLYPPVAASAPFWLLPEQAANWAYPQPDMDDEQIVFTLATGMLGRLYLSGHLDVMSPEQMEIVRTAVQVHKGIRDDLARATPVWPLGLPDWSDPWVALGLTTDQDTYLTLWHRGVSPGAVELSFPVLAGAGVDVVPVFPGPTSGLGAWTFEWVADEGLLRVSTDIGSPSARVIRLRRTA